MCLRDYQETRSDIQIEDFLSEEEKSLEINEKDRTGKNKEAKTEDT